MSKRANGEGSIRHKANGRWEARFSVMTDQGLKSVSTSGATRKEAAERMKQYRLRAESGAPLRDARIKVRDWYADWKSGSLAASNRAQSTKDQYAGLVNTHAIPVLGESTLDKVRPTHIEQLLAGCDLAASSKRSLYAALRDMFAVAVRDGLRADNPVEKVKRPPSTPPAPRSLPVDDVKRLVKATADHRYGAAVVLAATLGMRRGEVLGLLWSDIDFAAGTLAVTGNLVRTSAGLIRTTPKTPKSLRTLPLPPATVAALKRHRRLQAMELSTLGCVFRDDAYVFQSEVGGPVEPRNLSRWYAVTTKELGIDDAGLHTLRHFAATTLLRSGAATVRDVADLLGHSSPTVTLDVYAAAIPESQARAVASVADLLA